METYKEYQHKSYGKLVRNHIYIKLDELLKKEIIDVKQRQKIKDEIYKLFQEMV